MSLSKQEQLLEYAKCLRSYSYAIETYLTTFDNTQKKFVPFKLFPKQKQLVKALKNHNFNIVTKPRQAGVTTTTSAFIALLTVLASKESPQKVLILANKQETAIDILKKVKDFITQLPDWFRLGDPDWFNSEKNSAKHFRLFNGSEVKALATSLDALRGYTPTFLMMDEAAYIEGGQEVWEAAQPSLSTGGAALLSSTPNGMDGLYYLTYVNAVKKENGFNIIRMYWYEDPRYNKNLRWIKRNEADEIIEDIPEKEYKEESYKKMVSLGYLPISDWYIMMSASLNNNKRAIAQELDCQFLGSGDNVVDDKYVNNHRTKYESEPIRVEWIDKNMWVWFDPIEGHDYILSVDVSSGSSDDYCGLHIVDYTDRVLVAEYQGKIAPDVAGEMAKFYGDKYDAFIVVDTTGGYGVATILKLIELGYPKSKLYYDSTLNVNDSDTNLKNHEIDGKLPGMNINKYRNTMISELERVVRFEEIQIKSSRLLNEFGTFVYKNNRPDHMKGAHDDLIMSLAMNYFAFINSFKKLGKTQEKTKAMIESIIVSNNEADTSYIQLNDRENNYLTTPHSAELYQQYDWLFSGMRNYTKK
jgi:hypothetical protein